MVGKNPERDKKILNKVLYSVQQSTISWRERSNALHAFSFVIVLL